MKRILFISLLLLSTVNFALAQKKYAEIKFENTTYDFGKFPGTEMCIHIYKYREYASCYKTGYRKLWLHSSFIHKEAY